MFIDPIIKLYTDDMGRFPVQSRSRNNYIMLAYHVDSNTIMVGPYKFWKTRPVNPTNWPLKKSGDASSSLSHQMSTTATHQKGPYAPSKRILLQSFLEFPTLSPTSYGTSSSHKPSSHLTSCANQILLQKHHRGNTSTSHSTSMPPRLDLSAAL